MCFVSPPKIETKVPPAPQRDPNASFLQNARATILRSRGARDTIKTSPLGDTGFGQNVRKAALLGQTST